MTNALEHMADGIQNVMAFGARECRKCKAALDAETGAGSPAVGTHAAPVRRVSNKL
jgi:hypothetical protein